MAVARSLLTPLVVAAAVVRSRRKETAASGARGTGNPYPSEPVRGQRRSGGDSGRSDSGAGQGLPPGGQADKPSQIPSQGWKQILKRAWKESNDDNVGLLSAGVAFYIFLALFPALIAAVTVYGLVADPMDVERQIDSLSQSLPPETASLIGDQLRNIATSSQSALGIGLVVSLLGALFAASGGVQNLMKAVNLAYDENETRNFIKLRATALLLTFAGVVFLAVAVGLVAVLPVVLDAVGLGSFASFLVSVGRWVGLVVFVLVALAVVYRYAPDRDNARMEWVGVGSIVATVLWILGSIGFSIYVTNFGSYGKTYGALAGVVVLLLWLYLTSYAILLGAEVNAEAEKQTAKDTTEGPNKPMGQRGAAPADNVVHA